MGHIPGDPDDLLDPCEESYVAPGDEPKPQGVMTTPEEYEQHHLEICETVMTGCGAARQDPTNAVFDADVCIKESNIPDAGVGVFANRDFKKGEIACIYPVHLIQKVQNGSEKMDLMCRLSNWIGVADSEDDEDWLKRKDEFSIDDVVENCHEYGVNVFRGPTMDILVRHDPTLPVAPKYYGGFLNDNGFRLGKVYKPEENNCSLGNAQLNNTCRLQVVCVKDIKEGEELCHSYGSGYWFGTQEGENHTKDEENKEKTRSWLMKRKIPFGLEVKTDKKIWRP